MQFPVLFSSYHLTQIEGTKKFQNTTIKWEIKRRAFEELGEINLILVFQENLFVDKQKMFLDKLTRSLC